MAIDAGDGGGCREDDDRRDASVVVDGEDWFVVRPQGVRMDIRER